MRHERKARARRAKRRELEFGAGAVARDDDGGEPERAPCDTGVGFPWVDPEPAPGSAKPERPGKGVYPTLPVDDGPLVRDVGGPRGHEGGDERRLPSAGAAREDERSATNGDDAGVDEDVLAGMERNVALEGRSEGVERRTLREGRADPSSPDAQNEGLALRRELEDSCSCTWTIPVRSRARGEVRPHAVGERGGVANLEPGAEGCATKDARRHAAPLPGRIRDEAL
jgi:hypothetical protein